MKLSDKLGQNWESFIAEGTQNMPQSTQPITDAIRRGDKNKALELIKQALSIDPKDIDVLLILATLVDEPTRKRQVLNRILSVAPTHKAAREMLLEMDRAEMTAFRSASGPATASQAASAPAPGSSIRHVTANPEVVSSSPVQQIAPDVSRDAMPARSPQPPKPQPEKPLVFRYSTVWLVVLYLVATVFCCSGVLIASQNIANSLPSMVMALVFGISALSVSSKVEVKQAGIRTSTLLGSTEIKWDEIAQLKSNSMKTKLELVSSKGKSVRVSTQVKGYPVVIEILRQKRPDLFGETVASNTQGMDRLQPTTRIDSPAFMGTKTFKKSFFRQYGLLLGLLPLCLLLFWLSFAKAETRTAFLVSAAFCGLFMLVPFFQVSGIKVEPNKLTVQTFFEEKEFSAHQIKEIKMQSVHGRYGRVTNFVNIIPVEGKKYPVSGFSEGDEIIYGFLMNWWARYQNR